MRLESTHLVVQAEADDLVPARSADEVGVRSREELEERRFVASVAAHRAPLERDAASDELGVGVARTARAEHERGWIGGSRGRGGGGS